MKKIALILTLSLFIASCSKKDETQTTPPQDQQQLTPSQQETQTQTTEQNKQDVSKNDEMKKEDVKQTDTKSKDENIKKPGDVSKKENIPDTRSDIDFTQLFAKRCAKCHGKDLKGKKDGGPDLTRSETQNKSDSKLFNIISTGVKADNEDDEDMPAFKGKLSDDEIKAAVEFIKKH
jgi:cytochrome c5